MSNHATDGLSMSEIQDKIRASSNPCNDAGIIEIVCAYLKSHKQDHTTVDAKRWISIMAEKTTTISLKDKSTRLIKESKSIRNPALLVYLKDRKIPFNIARQYLSELRVFSHTHHMHYFVLGFPNEEGYYISNPLLESWIGEPTISFIPGQKSISHSLHIFQDFWDYLSLLAHFKVNRLNRDSIILNSSENVSQVNSYIYQSSYKEAHLWLPNNPDGKKLVQYISRLCGREKNLTPITMNRIYQPFNSLNDWYIAQANQ